MQSVNRFSIYVFLFCSKCASRYRRLLYIEQIWRKQIHTHKSCAGCHYVIKRDIRLGKSREKIWCIKRFQILSAIYQLTSSSLVGPHIEQISSPPSARKKENSFCLVPDRIRIPTIHILTNWKSIEKRREKRYLIVSKIVPTKITNGKFVLEKSRKRKNGQADTRTRHTSQPQQCDLFFAGVASQFIL